MSRNDQFSPHIFLNERSKYSFSWVCPWCLEQGKDVSSTGGDERTRDLAKALCESSINFHKYSGSCVKVWEKPTD